MTTFQCLDCQNDDACIICQECFQNSDHQGHRVKCKINASGCCDCGDLEAWKKEGCCTKHQGIKNTPSLQYFNQIQGEKKAILIRCLYFLNYLLQAGFYCFQDKQNLQIEFFKQFFMIFDQLSKFLNKRHIQQYGYQLYYSYSFQ